MRTAINDAVKVAMKARDDKRLTTLRMINAKIKDADIAARPSRDRIDDPEVLELLAKMIKQRRESVTMYNQGARPELAALEEAEIAVIQEFLPKGLSETEAKEAIAGVIKEIGANSVKDMGKVMAALKERFAGRMDFGKAGGQVKELLK